MSDARLLTAKLRDLAGQARHLPRAARLVRAAAGGWTLAWGGLLVLQGLLPIALVYLTKWFVDALVAQWGSAAGAGVGWDGLNPVLTPAALLVVTLLMIELLRGIADWVRAVQARQIEDHVAGLIHAKATSVDLALYESSRFHDHLHRAANEASYRPVALLENAGSLIQNGITLIAMTGVLLPYGWWLSAALVLSSVPALVVVLRHALRQHQWRRDSTVAERQAAYLSWLMTSSQAAAELRLFGLGRHYQAAHRALRDRLRGQYLVMIRSQGVAEFLAGALALLAAAACVAWMVVRALQGALTLGDLALFQQAFSQGQRMLRGLLGAVGELYFNLLFIGNLFEFLDLESHIADPAKPVVRVASATTRAPEIRFDAVTFHYPDSDRKALDALDLTLASGQLVAIVGANGSGKSTLLKLLCRLFDPQSGAITFDGVNIRAMAVNEVRGMIAVMLQEPVHYNATVAENVVLDAPDVPANEARIHAALAAAGAESLVARLPHGIHTLLGKWFPGGTELSTGEWQRLALARAFLLPAPVIVLDEPTSAMDVWAETDWLTRFRTVAAGRTALIVTHRFTTAMQADVIHVLEAGRIVESGSHAALVRLNGVYARAWHAQNRMAGPAVVQAPEPVVRRA